MDKVNTLGERLKIGGTEVSQKITAGMSSMSIKMREFFQGPNQTDKLVEEATAETLDEPDWATNLELCDMVNHDRINSVELIRGIKKRVMLKSPRIQYLSLVLLETVTKNCEKAFSEVAAERVLDEMVKLIDDPQTVVNNRNKALMLIESWGESSNELRYLPVYEETYKVHYPQPKSLLIFSFFFLVVHWTFAFVTEKHGFLCRFIFLCAWIYYDQYLLMHLYCLLYLHGIICVLRNL